jgi:hypothetical protein
MKNYGIRRDRQIRIAKIARAIDNCVWPPDDFGFTRINAEKYLARITPRYKDDLKWLVEHRYLEIDEFFVPRLRSNGYKLLKWPDFEFDIASVVDDPEPEYAAPEQYLAPFRHMTLDMAQIRPENHELPVVKRWVANDFRPSKRKDGRLYTALTSMPVVVRRGLVIDGQPAVEVDIKTAQPYFVAILSGDSQMYRAVKSGDFYELFGMSRDKAKEYWGRLVHSGSVWDAKRITKHRHVFALKYPLAFEWLLEQEWRLRHQLTDQKVAHTLFHAESNVMIDHVLDQLLQDGCIAGSIHDSIITSQKNGNKVAKLIKKKCKDVFGAAPQVTIKSVLEHPEWKPKKNRRKKK